MMECHFSRQEELFHDPEFEGLCLKIQRSILMLLLKKHLKSEYSISSTTVALASLQTTVSGINKRDRVLNKSEHPPVSIPDIIVRTPHNCKEMIALIKLFQSLTFVDPVEQAPSQKGM